MSDSIAGRFEKSYSSQLDNHSDEDEDITFEGSQIMNLATSLDKNTGPWTDANNDSSTEASSFFNNGHHNVVRETMSQNVCIDTDGVSNGTLDMLNGGDSEEEVTSYEEECPRESGAESLSVQQHSSHSQNGITFHTHNGLLNSCDLPTGANSHGKKRSSNDDALRDEMYNAMSTNEDTLVNKMVHELLAKEDTVLNKTGNDESTKDTVLNKTGNDELTKEEIPVKEDILISDMDNYRSAVTKDVIAYKLKSSLNESQRNSSTPCSNDVTVSTNELVLQPGARMSRTETKCSVRTSNVTSSTKTGSAVGVYDADSDDGEPTYCHGVVDSRSYFLDCGIDSDDEQSLQVTNRQQHELLVETTGKSLTDVCCRNESSTATATATPTTDTVTTDTVATDTGTTDTVATEIVTDTVATDTVTTDTIATEIVTTATPTTDMVTIDTVATDTGTTDTVATEIVTTDTVATEIVITDTVATDTVTTDTVTTHTDTFTTDTVATDTVTTEEQSSVRDAQADDDSVCLRPRFESGTSMVAPGTGSASPLRVCGPSSNDQRQPCGQADASVADSNLGCITASDNITNERRGITKEMLPDEGTTTASCSGMNGSSSREKYQPVIFQHTTTLEKYQPVIFQHTSSLHTEYRAVLGEENKSKNEIKQLGNIDNNEIAQTVKEDVITKKFKDTTLENRDESDVATKEISVSVIEEISGKEAKDSSDLEEISGEETKDSSDLEEISDEEAKDSSDLEEISGEEAKDSSDLEDISGEEAKDSSDLEQISGEKAKDSSDVKPIEILDQASKNLSATEFLSNTTLASLNYNQPLDLDLISVCAPNDQSLQFARVYDSDSDEDLNTSLSSAQLKPYFLDCGIDSDDESSCSSIKVRSDTSPAGSNPHAINLPAKCEDIEYGYVRSPTVEAINVQQSERDAQLSEAHPSLCSMEEPARESKVVDVILEHGSRSEEITDDTMPSQGKDEFVNETLAKCFHDNIASADKDIEYVDITSHSISKLSTAATAEIVDVDSVPDDDISASANGDIEYVDTKSHSISTVATAKIVDVDPKPYDDLSISVTAGVVDVEATSDNSSTLTKAEIVDVVTTPDHDISSTGGLVHLDTTSNYISTSAIALDVDIHQLSIVKSSDDPLMESNTFLLQSERNSPQEWHHTTVPLTDVDLNSEPQNVSTSNVGKENVTTSEGSHPVPKVLTSATNVVPTEPNQTSDDAIKQIFGESLKLYESDSEDDFFIDSSIIPHKSYFLDCGIDSDEEICIHTDIRLNDLTTKQTKYSLSLEANPHANVSVDDFSTPSCVESHGFECHPETTSPSAARPMNCPHINNLDSFGNSNSEISHDSNSDVHDSDLNSNESSPILYASSSDQNSVIDAETCCHLLPGKEEFSKFLYDSDESNATSEVNSVIQTSGEIPRNREQSAEGQEKVLTHNEFQETTSDKLDNLNTCKDTVDPFQKQCNTSANEVTQSRVKTEPSTTASVDTNSQTCKESNSMAFNETNIKNTDILTNKEKDIKRTDILTNKETDIKKTDILTNKETDIAFNDCSNKISSERIDIVSNGETESTLKKEMTESPDIANTPFSEAGNAITAQAEDIMPELGSVMSPAGIVHKDNSFANQSAESEAETIARCSNVTGQTVSKDNVSPSAGELNKTVPESKTLSDVINDSDPEGLATGYPAEDWSSYGDDTDCDPGQWAGKGICLFCRDPSDEMVFCQFCFSVKYCSERCRLRDETNHTETCERWERFQEMKERVLQTNGSTETPLVCHFHKIPTAAAVEANPRLSVNLLAEIIQVDSNYRDILLTIQDLAGKATVLKLRKKVEERVNRTNLLGEIIPPSQLLKVNNFVFIGSAVWRQGSKVEGTFLAPTDILSVQFLLCNQLPMSLFPFW